MRENQEPADSEDTIELAPGTKKLMDPCTEEEPSFGDLGKPIKLEEIEGFEKKLTPKARKLYAVKQYSTCVEYNHEVTKGKHKGQWARRVTFCQYFSKPVYGPDPMVTLTQKGNQELEGLSGIEWAIDKLAQTFNWLVEKDLVGHGVLANAIALPLVQVDSRPRWLLMLYVFPHKDVVEMLKEEYVGVLEEFDEALVVMNYLNKRVGCEGFCEEGQIGNESWETLPPVD